MVAALITAGCVGDDTETTTFTDDGMEVTTTMPEGAEDQWCPVGTTWEAVNPQTGESMTMEITGTETVNGIEMCKAMVEIDPVVDGIAKMGYLWTEGGESVIWTNYNKSGNVYSKVSMLDGKMSITAENGEVMEFDMTE
ncbi:hypothetical protein [Methanococcoides burtonii]|uniref:Uncharacterized protein n=1 Tax=Methanococcoides burtonii (strain DSM 6242 / NBRC 107633 / OCM 468 / ACE-M) TaxID=259564 RepID=Q12XP2_METBU|nr:hypothetical protein [Methanococcoides burtonii]ABE51784.1 Hypothetical protein Mbur_0830 [Methanococcoides burtonii DSM 6242]